MKLFIKDLSPELLELAVANKPNGILTDLFLDRPLCQSFSWDLSTEGYEFWEKVYQELTTQSEVLLKHNIFKFKSKNLIFNLSDLDQIHNKAIEEGASENLTHWMNALFIESGKQLIKSYS